MTLSEYFELLEKATNVGRPRLWAPDAVVRGVAHIGSWALGYVFEIMFYAILKAYFFAHIHVHNMN